MIGIDAVDVERLRAALRRNKALERRLFTPTESSYCHAMPDPVTHLAGTLAVKEAVIKAGQLGSLLAWGRRIEVRRDANGAPQVAITGVTDRGFAISISHDGPVAVAVAMATDPAPVAARNGNGKNDLRPRPNRQLMRYLAPAADRREVSARQLRDAGACFAGTDFP